MEYGSHGQFLKLIVPAIITTICTICNSLSNE